MLHMSSYAPMSSYAKGLAITAGGVLVLSPDAVLLRLIDADAWTVLFWRGLMVPMGVAAILFAFYGRGAWDQVRRMARPEGLAAAMFALSTIFFVLAIANTLVANTLVMISASPLFAALASRVFLGERVRPATWVALVVVLGGAGILLFEGLGRGTLFGDLCALGAALALSGNLVALRRAGDANPLPALAVGSLAVAFVAAPFAQPLQTSANDLLLLAVLGMGVVPVAFGLIFMGPRYLPAPEVGLLMLLETLLGPLWVWLAVGEEPRGPVLAAGALMVATLVVHAALGLRRGLREGG